MSDGRGRNESPRTIPGGEGVMLGLDWHRRDGWHAQVGRSGVWGCRTPWGALHGAWRLHQHVTGRRHLSQRRTWRQS